MERYVCYTLDLEEDHAGLLNGYYEGLNHLEEFLEVIAEREMPVSFFVQGKLIDMFPEKIELLKENGFDVHVHSYHHFLNPLDDLLAEKKEILKSRDVYREFFGRDPLGYRFPLGKVSKEHYQILKEAGFKFDSSVFPTLRPGHFNNLDKPLNPYIVGDMVEIPFSVMSPVLRLPVALSYMKLFYPIHFLKRYSSQVIVFDFHMHDLYDLKSTRKLSFIHRIPYMRNPKKGLHIFLKFSEKLRGEGYVPVPITEIYKQMRSVDS